MLFLAGSRTILSFPDRLSRLGVIILWEAFSRLVAQLHHSPSALDSKLGNGRETFNIKEGKEEKKKDTHTNFPTAGSQLTRPVEGHAKNETPVCHTYNSAHTLTESHRRKYLGITQNLDPHVVPSSSFV
jgi:hypothetical protein